MVSHEDLALLHTFATVARQGSFTRAATALGLSKSVVSERIRVLEDRLGLQVLRRNTRQLHLTTEGESILEVALELGAALERVAAIAEGHSAQPSGPMRVACTGDLGPLLVAPTVARLALVHPRVRFEILSGDHLVDLLAAGIDIAVRLGAPKDSPMTVHKLARFVEPIVAAPAVAGALGAITSPAALSDARWVRHALVSKRTMQFHGPGGARAEIEPEMHVQADSAHTVLSLLLQGAGVGCLPEYQLREHVAAGRLIHLCRGWVWKEVILYVLMPPRGAIRPIHRIFVDALRAQLALDELRWRPAFSLPTTTTTARGAAQA